MSIFGRRREERRRRPFWTTPSEAVRRPLLDDDDTLSNPIGEAVIVEPTPESAKILPDSGPLAVRNWDQPRFPYSNDGIIKLEDLDQEMAEWCWKLADHYDTSIIETYRSPIRQLELYNKGRSKVKIGRHNSMPSMAVDMAPYPIDWNDIEQFVEFGFFAVGLAAGMGLDIRWGGDWDGDKDRSDQTFNDLVHFEKRVT